MRHQPQPDSIFISGVPVLIRNEMRFGLWSDTQTELRVVVVEVRPLTPLMTNPR